MQEQVVSEIILPALQSKTEVDLKSNFISLHGLSERHSYDANTKERRELGYPS